MGNTTTFTFSDASTYSLPNASSIDYNSYSAQIPSGQTLIGVEIGNGVQTIDANTFQNQTTLSSVTFSSGDPSLTTIGDYAFDGCSVLNNITLPVSVNSIGTYCFQNCTSLTSILIPILVSSIPDGCFNGCSSLNDLSILNAQYISSVGTNTFTGTAPNITVSYTGASASDYLPEALAMSQEDFTSPTFIYNGANSYFYFTDGTYSYTDASLVTRTVFVVPTGFQIFCVSLGTNCTAIGDYCFNGFTYLSTVFLSNSIKIMGIATFYGNTSLTCVNISTQVTVIPNYAFYSCTALTSMSIPPKVTTINSGAFTSCSLLSSLVFENAAVVTNVDADNCFRNTASGIHVTYNNVTSYATLPSALRQTQNQFTSPTFTYGSLQSYFFFNDGSIQYSTDTTLSPSSYNDTSPSSLIEVNIASNVSILADNTFNNADLLGQIIFINSQNISSVGTNVFTGVAVGIVIYYGYAYDSTNLPDALSSSQIQFFNSNPTYYYSTVFTMTDSSLLSTFDLILTSSSYGLNTSTLQSVVISNIVQSLQFDCFKYCNNLVSVTIPSTITSLPANCFDSCSRLTSIELPSSINFIDTACFQNSGLTSIDLPDALTTIGNGVFYNCIHLASVNMSPLSQIASIGGGTFGQCTALTSFDIPYSLTHLGYGCFFSSGLTSLYIPDSVTVCDQLILGGCNNLTSVTGMNNITTIPQQSLAYNPSLTSITIPFNITTLGPYCFSGTNLLTMTIYDAQNITSVDSTSLPNTITNIVYYNAASYADLSTALKNAQSQTPSATYTYMGLGLVSYFNYADGTIGTSTDTNITSNSFSIPTGSQLTGMALSPSVSTIGDNTFANTNLITAYIPYNVSSLGVNCFDSCSDLQQISFIPMQTNTTQLVTAIPSYAFNNCSNIYTCNIPTNITTLQNNAFFGCSNLSILVFLNAQNIITIENDCFSNTATGITVKYYFATNLASLPTTSPVTFLSMQTTQLTQPTNLYSTIFTYSDASTSCSFDSTLTSASYSVPSSQSLVNIDFADTVVAIGPQCFQGQSISSVNLSYYIKSLGAFCFASTNLTSIDIPDTVTFIAPSVFNNCYNLTSVTLNNTLSYVSDSLFKGCSGLGSIIIPLIVTSVQDEAFNGCSNLRSITFTNPTIIENIGVGTFASTPSNINVLYNCPSYGYLPTTMQLTQSQFYNPVYLYSSLFTYSNGTTSYSFDTAISDTSYIIPQNLALNSVVFSSSVTSIAAYSFNNITALNTVTFSDAQTVSFVGNDCFTGTAVDIDVYYYNVVDYSQLSIALQNSQSQFNTSNFYYMSGFGNLYHARFNILLAPAPAPALKRQFLARRTVLVKPAKALKSLSLPINDVAEHEPIRFGIGLYTVFTYSDNSTYNSYDTTIIPSSYNIHSGLPLIAVSLGAGVSALGANAFSGQTQLTTMSIPINVTSIGNYVFDECTGLTSVVGLQGISVLPLKCFHKCTNLTSFTIPSNITQINSYSFYLSGITSLNIPSTVTTINDYAFYGMYGLASIYGFAGISSFSKFCFTSCILLTDITIPPNILTIGEGAFQNSGLTSINIPSTVTSIGIAAFKNCVNLSSVTGLSSLTYIATEVFAGCTELTSFTIPPNLRVLSLSVFSNSGLTDIYIPSTVLSVAQGCFSSCPNLAAVTGLTGLTYLYSYTFSNCAELSSINLPSNIREIGQQCFNNDTSLLTVTFNNSKNIINVSSGAFTNTGNGINVYYLNASYYTDLPYALRSTQNQFTYGVYHYISYDTVIEFTDLSTVNITDTILSYSSYSSLIPVGQSVLSVTIGAYVTEISEDTFANQSTLNSVDFTYSYSLLTIGNSAFASTAITSIAIPNTVTQLGSYCFQNCIYLNTITLSNHLTIIPAYCFSATAVTSIDIPHGVTSIEGWAFGGCNSLASVTLPSTLTSLGDDPNGGAFNSTAITAINVPASVTTMYTGVFNSCESLVTVTGFDGLTYIPAYTFQNCVSFSGFTFNTSMQNIYEYAFDGCTLMTELTFLDTQSFASGSIDSSAFTNVSRDVSPGALQVNFYNASDYAALPSALQPLVENLLNTTFNYFNTCFNEDTQILCLMPTADSYADMFKMVADLQIGDLVKTYKHGYRRVTKIISGKLTNNPEKYEACMYKYVLPFDDKYKDKEFKPLLVTGGHSILEQFLTRDQKREQNIFTRGTKYEVNNNIDTERIDDKFLHLCALSSKFEKVLDNEVYTYYNFTLENDGDCKQRYGVYANGVLMETPSENFLATYDKF